MSKLMRSLVIFGVLAIIAVTLLFKSMHTIEPGEQGVIFHPFGKGIDTVNVYPEGTIFILPWNKLITYDIRQKNIDMALSVLEKNGLEVEIDMSITYHPTRGKIGNLHLKTGLDYKDVIVIPNSRSAGREVIGKYSAEELYSTKREQLQVEIEDLLSNVFNENFLSVDKIMIRDVNLPESIKQSIINKQTQDQKNDLAKKLEKEQEFIANALRTEARGKKDAAILIAEGKSQSIKLLQQQLKSSPQYTELMKVQAFEKTGKSWYGNNNVYGSNAATVIKGINSIK